MLKFSVVNEEDMSTNTSCREFSQCTAVSMQGCKLASLTVLHLRRQRYRCRRFSTIPTFAPGPLLSASTTWFESHIYHSASTATPSQLPYSFQLPSYTLHCLCPTHCSAVAATHADTPPLQYTTTRCDRSSPAPSSLHTSSWWPRSAPSLSSSSLKGRLTAPGILPANRALLTCMHVCGACAILRQPHSTSSLSQRSL